jgi:putative addiction module killer protein
MTEAIEVRRYVTKNGRDVFGHWLSGLKDARTAAKIISRLDRLALGNFGDCKALGGGLFELRIDWGPGYRVYYAMSQRTCVLFCAGHKGRQFSDIQRAREYLEDYWKRTL